MKPGLDTISDPVLTPAQAAARLAIRLSTLYRWSHERRLASLKIYGALRFRASTIDALLKASERPARRDGLKHARSNRANNDR